MFETGYWWYDSKVTHMEREPTPSEGKDTDKYTTPQAIYNYLNTHIWKQDEAKKAAAMLMWKVQHGIKENLMFVGPSGSGKTEIWRCLQQLFPNIIVIADASNITCDGWKGETKWSTLLSNPIFRESSHKVLVLDEADKMLTPKYTSHSENYSHAVQSEGLKILEGTTVSITDNSISYQLDTCHIAFVLCGAFSTKADEIADKSKGCSIGFGAVSDEVRSYNRPFTAQDIIDFGAMPEFMGRIQKVVNLEPMAQTDYFQMLSGDDFSLIHSLEKQYGINVSISRKKCQELAKCAYESGLGMRSIANQIRNMVDDSLFANPDCKSLKF